MPSNLVVFVVTMALSGLCSAQAPGDEASRCITGSGAPSYPDNVKMLMDSWSYENLLVGTGSGFTPVRNPVWTEISCDDNDRTSATSPTYWQHGSGGLCRFQTQVCGYRYGNQDNWLFTQHISKAFPEETNCPADGNVIVFVNITYNFQSCRSRYNCNPRFRLYTYFTDSQEDFVCNDTKTLFSSSGITPNNTIGPVPTGLSFTHQRTFHVNAQQNGFYLAIQDFNVDDLRGTCIRIARLMVYRHECPANKMGLVSYPTTPAPSAGTCPTLAICAENAHNISSLEITCDSDGNWGNEDPQCECDPGYVEKINGICEACSPGTYSSSGQCEVCPANTLTTAAAVGQCECERNYFRNNVSLNDTCSGLPLPANENATAACTAPPSPPENVNVMVMSATQMQVTWSPPSDAGGRSDVYYIVEHSDPDNSREFVVATCMDSSSATSLMYSDMRAGTQYCVRVSSHNGVSDQDPDNAATRYVEICVVMDDAPPGEVDGIIASCPIIVWNSPQLPNGVVNSYRLEFCRGGSCNTIETDSDQTYYVIQSDDVPGTLGDFTVTVSAGNSAGYGPPSSAITVSCDDCPTTTPPTIVRPGSPEDVVALGCGIVGWKQPSNTGGEIVNYIVRFFDGETAQLSPYLDLQRDIDSRQTWAVARNLPSTRPIYVEIRAKNSAGASDWSTKVIVTNDSLCPTEAPTEPVTCPPCPTCAPPTECETCAPPTVCPTCPACPTCAPPTVCPTCPACPTCAPPVECPTCPECPSLTPTTSPTIEKPEVPENVTALGCGIVGWERPNNTGGEIEMYIVRFFDGETVEASSYRELQRDMDPKRTWAIAQNLPSTRPILYAEIRAKNSAGPSPWSTKIIVANDSLCEPPPTEAPTEPVTCPPCPTCAPPVVCETCAPPVVCEVCPTCETCAPPTVCPTCPETTCPTCPETTCLTCPECPSLTPTTSPTIEKPEVPENVTALGCGIVVWRTPNNTGGEIEMYIVRFYDGQTVETSSYRELQRDIDPKRTWAIAQNLSSTRPIYAEIRARNSAGGGPWSTNIIVADDLLCELPPTDGTPCT